MSSVVVQWLAQLALSKELQRSFLWPFQRSVQCSPGGRVGSLSQSKDSALCTNHQCVFLFCTNDEPASCPTTLTLRTAAQAPAHHDPGYRRKGADGCLTERAIMISWSWYYWP